MVSKVPCCQLVAQLGRVASKSGSIKLQKESCC